jgi:hypothetical protein
MGMLFDVPTPLRFRVHTTLSYWDLIVTMKHPAMHGCQQDVEEALMIPDEIRRSRIDPDVYLFYRAAQPDRWTRVVVKRSNGEGFVITTYPTDAIKAGDRIWTR